MTPSLRMTVRVVIAILVAAAIAWQIFHRDDAAIFALLIPTDPVACPENPNDLSGIAQAGVQSSGALAGGAANQSPTSAPTGTCMGLAAPLVGRFAQIQNDLRKIPTDGFDPAQRGGELANLYAVFAFVRDDIQTDGYAGAMRGPSGTLQARAGSPADKALLLATLLGAKGYLVRFAHAALTDDQVAQVEGAVVAPRPSPAAQDLSTLFEALNLDPQTARNAANAFARRMDATADSVVADAAAPTDALVATLASSKIELATDDGALRTQWKAALRDHWWLQAFANGDWFDLDPTLPNALPGSHVGGKPDRPVDALPDGERDALTVGVVATRMGAGGPAQSTTLVQRTIKLTDAYAQPIVVSIGDRTTGSAGIAHATTFTPSIDAGGNGSNGASFTTDNLATVELQMNVVQPGMAPRSYRRTIVDRRTAGTSALDPAWTPERTAYALTGIYDLLPLAGDLDPGFAGLREGEGLQMVQAFMAYVAAGGDGTQMPPPAGETYPMQALHYYEYDAIVRRRLENAGRGAVRFFFDRPELAIEHRGFTLVDGTVAGVAQFDVVENGMSATGSAPAAAIRANFTRGYVDEYAEQHMTSAPNDGGTIELLKQAQRDGVPVQVFSGPEYGGTAIAPVGVVTVGGTARRGWWQVDPTSGNLIGRMGPSGAGQELAEYAIARANDWSTLYAMTQFYGDFFHCIAGSADAPLSGALGTKGGFRNCAMPALCSYLDGVGSGYALGEAGFTDLESVIYNILDLRVPGTKYSYPPTGGAACGAMFRSPLYPSP